MGSVEILVGREWFWWAKPRRPIDVLDDIEQAAIAIIETLRRAQLRVATRRRPDHAPALDGWSA
ncbi:hypothetical protein ABZ801_39505 [Actinomadura sp. NPDC047616]|uniref:hypothetical protein n=1 Tax=Actinomadura sp. NPDC047616 TaxID=3155914 RepID=UPI00340B8030